MAGFGGVRATEVIRRPLRLCAQSLGSRADLKNKRSAAVQLLTKASGTRVIMNQTHLRWGVASFPALCAAYRRDTFKLYVISGCCPSHQSLPRRYFVLTFRRLSPAASRVPEMASSEGLCNSDTWTSRSSYLTSGSWG